MRHAALLAAWMGLLLLGACHKGPPAPVDIVLDEDSCVVCRMAVSQLRYGSEVVTADGTAQAFDDLGCLVEYMRKPGPPAGAAVYVVDFDSLGWLPADSAVYLHAKTLPSPMSYGLAAFKDRTSAEVQAKQYPGDIWSWEQLQREFKP